MSIRSLIGFPLLVGALLVDRVGFRRAAMLLSLGGGVALDGFARAWRGR